MSDWVLDGLKRLEQWEITHLIYCETCQKLRDSFFHHIQDHNHRFSEETDETDKIIECIKNCEHCREIVNKRYFFVLFHATLEKLHLKKFKKDWNT